MALKDFFTGLAIAVVASGAILAGLVLDPPSSFDNSKDAGQSAQVGR